MPASAVTYVLAVYLLLVLLDATRGFKLFRRAVHAGSGVYCAVTRRSGWERTLCTERVFRSRITWVLVSLLMGAITLRVATDLSS